MGNGKAGHSLQAGHQPVSRPGPQIGDQIDAAANAGNNDSGGRLGKTQSQRVETGQKGKRNVKHHGYDDDIKDGSHSRFLPQRNPQQQHQRTDNEGCEADAPPGVKRNALCEYCPGADAGTRCDQ